MKLLRLFFVLLLCAMLPLSGLAASGLTGQCPMQAAMGEHNGAMSTNMADCDSMKPASGDDGKAKASLCKVAAGCQMGSLYHPVSALAVVRLAGSFFPLRFQYEESLSVRAPDGLWRPPQNL